ncbi:UNVERIFIED_CONTAM: hypothetical protein GTU68_003617 [Idotea baltica]|nr:hypothetical protein [Idotea baltica]
MMLWQSYLRLPALSWKFWVSLVLPGMCRLS